MKKIVETIFDLIFPRRKNDAAICDIKPEDFYRKMPRWSGKEVYPDMRAIFHYQNPLTKSMIKELKSGRNDHAAQIAAHALANFFQENNICGAIIVPMPISRKRRKKRGYNQCEFLTEYFLQELSKREKSEQGKKDSNTPPQTAGVNFDVRTDILEKQIDTPKLALQDRVARLKANKGVFQAPFPLSSIKRRIIVIDDVITTGSTMHSAMETLRAAGAKRIFGIGISH